MLCPLRLGYAKTLLSLSWTKTVTMSNSTIWLLETEVFSRCNYFRHQIYTTAFSIPRFCHNAQKGRDRVSTIEPETKQTKKGSGKAKRVKLKTHPDLDTCVKQYPFLSKRRYSGKNRHVTYTVHPYVVELVVKEVLKNLSKETVVMESNPGPGFLTKALLKAGVSKLRIYETHEKFVENLEDLACEFPDRLKLVKQDLLLLPSLTASDFISPAGYLEDIFQGIPTKPWQESPPILLIGNLTGVQGTKFLRFLLKALVSMDSIYSFGRAELLVFIQPNEYAYINAVPKLNYSFYRPISVIYKLLFEFQAVDQVPKDYFLPPVRPLTKMYNFDRNYLYLVRLVPRADLFDLISKEKLPELVFFIHQNLFSRNSYVIPNLEKWIPNCGPEFIKQGMGLFTKFGDLSPQEILGVFHTFSSLPEYKYCSFKTAYKSDKFDFKHVFAFDLLEEEQPDLVSNECHENFES